MIAGVFDRLERFFGASFFVSALFPVVVLFLIFSALTVSVLGLEATAEIVRYLNESAGIAFWVLAALPVLLAAMVLRTLQETILAFWSGQGATWSLLARKEIQLYRRRKLTAKIQKSTSDFSFFDTMLTTLGPHQAERAGQPVPEAELQAFLRNISDLKRARSLPPFLTSQASFLSILEQCKALYKKYDETSLEPAWTALFPVAETADAEANIGAQTQKVELDAWFGSIGTEQSTALGNVMEAINSYPFRRYHIEGSVFWPYIVQAAKGEIKEQIGQMQMLLDAGLSLTTIFALTGATVALVGPWIAWQPCFWLIVAAASGAGAIFMYNVSLRAAISMGRVLRAACDLYRLDALHQLYRPHPGTLQEERGYWRELSQLAVNGDVNAMFNLRPREEEVDDTSAAQEKSATHPPHDQVPESHD